MNESTFQQELKKSIHEQGGWAEKFPDAPRYNNICQNCGTEVQGGSRFIPTKRFDIIAKYQGKPIGIECKIASSYNAFPLSKFQSSKEKKNDIPWQEWNQVKSLRDFEDNQGSTAWVFLNIRNGDKRINDLIVISISDLITYFEAGQKSVKKKDLPEYFLVNGGKGRFNLESFFSDFLNI